MQPQSVEFVVGESGAEAEAAAHGLEGEAWVQVQLSGFLAGCFGGGGGGGPVLSLAPGIQRRTPQRTCE